MMPNSVESEFLESEDLVMFENDWIAILGKKVIANARTIEEVFDLVTKSALSETPLYHKIPSRNEPEIFIS